MNSNPIGDYRNARLAEHLAWKTASKHWPGSELFDAAAWEAWIALRDSTKVAKFAAERFMKIRDDETTIVAPLG